MRLARAALLALSIALPACDTHRAAPAPAPGPAAAQAVEPRPVEVIRREGNHLVGQPSAYLEQHAHNPVEWYPWGDEAIARARRDNKPIFLSIGYSTCHWCHVMEHESFEDDETARYLNRYFVAIKVDREMRPDLDALFIEAVGKLGGSTGWPLTVFLTPDLEPFFGGTYFPSASGRGLPSFMDVLHDLAGKWGAEGAAVARKGREILAQIRDDAEAVGGGAGDVSESLLRVAFARLASSRDTREGGFGSRQKFPTSPLLLAELRFIEAGGPNGSDADTRAHLVLTLERAMRGGIRDHLAGTFHRYATDRTWHVPHFEKTLYDNAQLAAVYVEAGRFLGRDDLVRIGRAVLDDLASAWQQPDGGMVVGFDADDPRGEGAYYTFTPAELTSALGEPDARIVCALFGVTEAGERSLGGRSVLHRREDAAVAASLSIPVGDVTAAEARALPKLRRVRDGRPAPPVDDKELASWNGLALTALADAGRMLDEPLYVEAAQRIGHFLVDRCWQAEARRMRRGLRRGESVGDGFLDDYALPALGLLRLHAADADPRWLLDAHAITAAMIERFHDAEHDSFVYAAAPAGGAGPSLPLRRPSGDDNVLPSGSSAATLLLLELGALTGDAAIYDRGARALRAAAGRIAGDPFSSGFLLVAVDHAVAKVREVVIAGAGDDPRTKALVRELASTTDARVLAVRLPAGGASAELVRAFPALEGKVALHGKATAFVCQHGACDAPTGDPAVLRRKIEQAKR